MTNVMTMITPAGFKRFVLSAMLIGLGGACGLTAPPAVVHEDMANASAIALLDPNWFVAASDESNVLQVFPVDSDGPSVAQVDLSGAAAVLGKSTEIDLEGAARIGDRVYWIGSHGRNKDGKPRSNRQRLMATRVEKDGTTMRLVPEGRPYSGLLTELLADPEQRDALHCIRCGACLNVCPVFRAIGGLSYGTTYQGPVGSVITPHLRGLQDWKHLSGASSLCGACTDTCPVKIDLHHHLLHNRRNAARERGGVGRWVGKACSFVMRRPFLYGMGMRLARLVRPLHAALLEGGVLDPVRAWTASRELPELAEETFRERWKRRGRE